jgi:hypothetical protein
MALVIFQKSFLLGLKVYYWPLIFISYQLTVVNGDIRVAGKETQLEHFRSSKSLFEVLEKRRTRLVTPNLRYVADGCCTDAEHGTSRADPEY